MRFLISVMFVCLLATPLPAMAAAGEGTELNLLTLNTWGLAYPVAHVRRGFRFPRIQGFLQHAGVQLAGLQEVWNGARHLLSLDGLRYGQRRHGDTGLALWTTLPVTEISEIPYRVSRGIDRLKHRGILRARVLVPDQGPRWAFVTPMQAGGGVHNAHVRAAQADQLLEEIAAVDGPVVVLGDFKLHTSQPADRATSERMEASGLVDAADRAGERTPTCPGDASRYDRIYLASSPGEEVRTEEAHVVHTGEHGIPLLSDHRPLVVRVRMERGADSAVGHRVHRLLEHLHLGPSAGEHATHRIEGW